MELLLSAGAFLPIGAGGKLALGVGWWVDHSADGPTRF
jgi:hypothetical protein